MSAWPEWYSRQLEPLFAVEEAQMFVVLKVRKQKSDGGLFSQLRLHSVGSDLIWCRRWIDVPQHPAHRDAFDLGSVWQRGNYVGNPLHIPNQRMRSRS